MLSAKKYMRDVAAAQLFAALHKAPSVPAEDGGEANPGSEGGARSQDRAEDMDGFASPPSSARAKQKKRQPAMRRSLAMKN